MGRTPDALLFPRWDPTTWHNVSPYRKIQSRCGLARLHLSHTQAMRRARRMTAADPVVLLCTMADHMSQGADAMRKVADAAAPVYATLDEAQKRRLQILVHMGSRGMMGGMMRSRSGINDDRDTPDTR
jgi:hypothetical protein